jgi:hypothetical protein
MSEKTLKAGDTVHSHGMMIRVIRGEHHCEDEDCDKPVVTIRDPESGRPDEVHVEDLR